MASWTCSTCALTMQEQSKKPHLSGKRHAAQAQQERNASGSADSKQIYVGNKSKKRSINNPQKANDDAALLASHRVSLIQGPPITSETRNPSVNPTDELPDYMAVSSISNDLLWKCTLCNLYMDPALGPAHLICEAHIERLVCSVRISGPTVRQDQKRRDLKGPNCKPGAPQASYLMHHAQLSNILIVQQGSDAGLPISVYNTEALRALNLLYDNMSKQKPTACLSAFPHDITEFDVHRAYTQHYSVSACSTPSIADNPLDQFFHSFSKFPYDACIPPATSYENLWINLSRWHDWDGHQPGTWEKYQQEVRARYEAALTREFNLWFGTEDDLKSWHALCKALGIIPLPLTCEACRSVSSLNKLAMYTHRENCVGKLI